MTELKRLHSLDATRGLAAIAVVVWHFQHFYLIGGGKLDDRTIQPFYDVLFPIYQYGWLAVEFFFTLSGFVFFWLYGQRIASKTLGPGGFWLARFSRLYPLHFITLVVVALLQVNLLAHGQESFIYGGTTWSNFGLNLLFLQYFAPGWTFNGPEWSVGVEIILYALFFLYCWMFKPHWFAPMFVYIAFGLWLMTTQWALGRGVIGFFAGGVAYEAWRRWRDLPRMASLAQPLFGVTVALWIYAMVESQFHLLTGLLDSMGVLGWWWVETAFRLILVPLTVFALALYEYHGAKWWQKVSPLGDLTYALYLWHFPLQLAIASAVLLLGVPAGLIQTPLGFLLFFAVLIAISIASYRWIERPAQDWIRTRFSARRAVVEKQA